MPMNRKELLALMPKSKSDAEGAEHILQLGYPAIAPVLKDMMLCLKNHDSIVADRFCIFFANLRPPAIELVSKQIGSTNLQLRNRILVDILPHWPPDAISALRVQLTTYATHPDCLNNDVACFSLIIAHDLADKAWVKQWLEFRNKQTAERISLIADLLSRLK